MTDQENVTPDYTKMDGPMLLQHLRDDAMSWAVAFNQHAVKLGYSNMDEGWLVGWFANAIEHSSAVREWRSKPDTTPVDRKLPKLRPIHSRETALLLAAKLTEWCERIADPPPSDQELPQDPNQPAPSYHGERPRLHPRISRTSSSK